MAKLAVGTRFFESKPENKDVALTRIAKWIQAAKTIADNEQIFVAVNVDADQIGSLKHLQKNFPRICVVPVTPWGKFVAPLNAIASAAARAGADQLLLTSAEFSPTREVYSILAEHLDDKTLVVGPRLDGHEFIGHLVLMASGRQIPWNTCALWDLRRLALTGFILIGDSPYDEKNAGVEELATMALHWHNWPQQSSVKMLSIPSMSGQWDKAGWDADRISAHEKKMASKVERPATHLSALDLRGPEVLHIQL